MDEWLAVILFSPEVEAKLRLKHNIVPDNVKDALLCGAHDTAVWNIHPIYGRRLIASGRDADGSILAYLRPIDDGVWECLTARRKTHG